MRMIRLKLTGCDAMISFEPFKIEGGSPIYAQMVLYIKRGIVSGAVADGDELPSRRALSALLGVNPNTVQKAYRILEEEGLVTSRTGAASYIVLDGDKAERVRRELLESDVGYVVRAMRQSGVPLEEVQTLIKKLWEEGGEHE